MKNEKNVKFPLNNMENWWKMKKNVKFPLNNMANWQEIEKMQNSHRISWKITTKASNTYTLTGRMEIHPCVLQDIGPLGPLPCSHSTSSANHSKQGIGYRWPCAILGWLVYHCPCPLAQNLGNCVSGFVFCFLPIQYRFLIWLQMRVRV